MPHDNDIAIIGMAARVPGARNIGEYWNNLVHGVESIRPLSEGELRTAGVDEATLRRPNYVRAAAPLADMEMFDGEFFGFSPKESAILDPQHRHLLECAWEAFEDAGHPPERFSGPVGVFTGCGMGSYFYFNLCTNPKLVRDVGMFLLRHTGNDKDFLSTRISYLLDLTGPSISIQTACSTSLVAVHYACQSLLGRECDMAVAGGVTIELPHRRGYLYQSGEVLSPDGHCRAFDAAAKGTVFGSGAAVVMLRRYADAVKDGDHIYALICGSAVNNDGTSKVGYLAPSVDGQAAAITEALAVADISADTIEYVEAHGTGTPMGDPIEITALTQAFRESSSRTGYCSVGSVKPNIGHLDTASGVAGLIKAALALHHEQIPPTLNYEVPNPQIPFDSSPFFVNKTLRAWSRSDAPRRASVNSLGVGGTNAHVVLQEAPEVEGAKAVPPRGPQVLMLSARNRGALDEASVRLAQHLRNHPEVRLSDVAYTLDVGRRSFARRRVLACESTLEAATLLESGDPRRVHTHSRIDGDRSLVFMFPGGGAQHVDMGRGLYDHELVFREHVDRGLEGLRDHINVDLRSIWFPDPAARPAAAEVLARPSIQLPAIFVLQFALAQLWRSKGVEPAAMIGHSLGENTAACLSGVFAYEDALGLVSLRGQLFETLELGGMLSVPLAADEVRGLLGDELDLAAVNGPRLSIVSGPRASLDALARALGDRDVATRRVKIDVAAHSRMLAPILEQFEAYLRGISLGEPQIPFVSNVTGTWIDAAQARDPSYWVRHLRSTVQFAASIETLAQTPGRVYLEVGPGRTLTSLAKQHPSVDAQAVLPSLPHADEGVADRVYFRTAMGSLRALGLEIELQFNTDGSYLRRVSLPGYPFQHQRYWIEAGNTSGGSEEGLRRIDSIDDWAYEPVWIPANRGRTEPAESKHTWLVFLDAGELGEQICKRLSERGDTVITVREGGSYRKRSDTEFVLAPELGRPSYEALVRDVVAGGHTPDRIAHMWLIADDASFRAGSSFYHHTQERGFYSLSFLMQALTAEAVPTPLHITVCTSGMQKVGQESLRYPGKATVLGPILVAPREFPGLTSRCVDLEAPADSGSTRLGTKISENLAQRAQRKRRLDARTDAIDHELRCAPTSDLIAYRGQQRFRRDLQRIEFPPVVVGTSPLRDGGTYLITGGLGGIGLALAAHLASRGGANLILVGRTPLPPRDDWDAVLANYASDHPLSRKVVEIRKIEAEGSKVSVHQADVTNFDHMTAVVRGAETRLGPIHGVIHAAGVVRDGLISLKSESDIDEVFASKIHGASVLDQIFEQHALDFMVLFSSSSVFVAPPGQVDYVAANAFLNAFAHERRQRRSEVTIALGWGVWADTGMAVDAHSGAKSGSVHRPASHPLFNTVENDMGTFILSAQYGPRTHWLLDEHRTAAGEALIPGTGYIEMTRAALTEVGEGGPFQLRDLFFIRPLAVGDETDRAVRLILRPNDEGYSVEIRSKETVGEAQGWALNSQAQILLTDFEKPKAIDLAAIQRRCQNGTELSAVRPIRARQERHLRFGPHWSVLDRVDYGVDEAIAQLNLDDVFAAELGDFGLHPGLLDLATGFAIPMIPEYDPSHLWVPVQYGIVRVLAPLVQHITSWARVRRGPIGGQDSVRFDITITDRKGSVLVEVEDFAMKQIVAGIDLRAQPQVRSSDFELENERVRDDGNSSLAHTRFESTLALGIRSAEGVEAFERALTLHPTSELIVSSIDLRSLRDAIGATGMTSQADTAFSRPQLDTEYVAARDDVERIVASLYEDLLGVDRVGIHDSFFDLGGHSLIAVRLFARIKRTYHVDFPISALFEAPTVARCADLIRESLHSNTDSPDSQADPAPRKMRHTHLVAMQDGTSRESRPFFMVAGMFGNVPNLRHLAHIVGVERPFYGLQARGLYGDQTPHHAFEDMAKDYIREIKSVQQNGPYLLGGFSGGGITALEMASQLRAAGDDVALLLMLDTPLPVPAEVTARDRAMIQWLRLRRQGVGYTWEWASNRVRWEVSLLRARFDETQEEPDPEQFRNDVMESAFRAALGQYKLRHYPGRITLFRPRLDAAYVTRPGRVFNRDRERVQQDNGWSPHATEVDVHEVPGGHDSMVLEPNVRVLGAKLRQCIAAAIRRSRKRPGASDFAANCPRSATQVNE
ncbi:MAG: SDR family NAD(P)-dependent oxidoreductase [Nannocystaceae bacterium]